MECFSVPSVTFYLSGSGVATYFVPAHLASGVCVLGTIGAPELALVAAGVLVLVFIARRVRAHRRDASARAAMREVKLAASAAFNQASAEYERAVFATIMSGRSRP
jgi:hypothetical protein